MTKSKKKGQIHAHTENHHGNDVLHRGEKRSYVCAYNEKKKKEKKSSGKRKNLAHTD
jgi:hypothetical protein